MRFCYIKTNFFQEAVCKKNISFCSLFFCSFFSREVPSSGGAGGSDMGAERSSEIFFFGLFYLSLCSQKKNPSWPGHVNAMGCFEFLFRLHLSFFLPCVSLCQCFLCGVKKQEQVYFCVCVCLCLCVCACVCEKQKKRKGQKEKKD